MLSLKEIHQLEISESYPAAIEALERRLGGYPDEEETIVRLGFNYWLMAEQGERISPNLPRDEYAQRFMKLFHEYYPRFKGSADFCFSFGLGISMFWHFYPGATECLGKDLLKQAAKLDSFYKPFATASMWFAKFKWFRGRLPSQEELSKRFAGRGVFARYYNVA